MAAFGVAAHGVALCGGNQLSFLALALHVARVFTSGAHLRPRELTWLSGALLALTASAAGVTGYALPWDQLGYWAFCIVSAMPAALDAYVAGRGAALVALLRGGPTLAQAGLSRCFFAHTLALPLAALLLLLAHFAAIRKQGISGPL
jgi:quinol-cytochrome oxidoreductase complex cytochrome b subunit